MIEVKKMDKKKLLDDNAFCRDCNMFIKGRCTAPNNFCSMYDMFSELREAYFDVKWKLKSLLIDNDK